MSDYSEAKIYQIYSIYDPNLRYVGSTIQKLLVRLLQHKLNYKIYLKMNKRYTSSFVIFKNCDDYIIELIELYPCKSREELNKREGYYIKTLNCVNSNIAGRTLKEWTIDNKEQIAIKRKQWSLDNKEQIAIKGKQYRTDNKEQIAITQKQYRIKNKKKIAIKNKQYRTDNKEKIAFKSKQYRTKNKEKIAFKSKQYRTVNKEKLKQYHKQYYQNKKKSYKS